MILQLIMLLKDFHPGFAALLVCKLLGFDNNGVIGLGCNRGLNCLNTSSFQCVQSIGCSLCSF